MQHDSVFQIWPKSRSIGMNGSDNRLREVQRNGIAALTFCEVPILARKP